MSRRRRRRWCPSGAADGAAATEFVLIAPILIVLFFGIVYIGLTVYRTQVIEAAAREGARVASVGGTMIEVEAAVDRAAVGFAIDEADVTPTALDDPTEPDPSDLCGALPDDTTIVVKAGGDDGRFSFTIPFLGSFNPDFEASATFRCEITETP